MSRARVIKFLKIGRFLLIFLLIFGWFFSGGPPTSLLAEEAISTPAVTPVATSTPEATSLPKTITSTTSTSSGQVTSTPADNSTSTSTPAVFSQSPTEELAPLIEIPPEEEFVEESAPQPEPQLESTPPTPPLKERKLTKEIHIDAGARHSCAAKNFNINLSGVNQAIVELEFTGARSDSENLEIGSLPLGIDITFLNNADYFWSPSKSDSGAVLQIVNQPGSQKGNFSIPIIYQSGNSTTICQINIINF